MSKKPGGGWSAKSWAGGKPPAVARHPHHAKGAGPSTAHLQREVNRLQRQVSHLQHSGKHPHSTAKHHPRKGSSKHAKRGLALGEMVACCAAEALAASLLLSSGLRASDADVLGLFLATPGRGDDGASLEQTFAAVLEHGLAGVRPSQIEQLQPGGHGSLILSGPAGIGDDGDRHSGPVHSASLILGVDLPGPHAVTVDADGTWLTWGERYDPAAFPDAVLEEAWAVTWP